MFGFHNNTSISDILVGQVFSGKKYNSRLHVTCSHKRKKLTTKIALPADSWKILKNCDFSKHFTNFDFFKFRFGKKYSTLKLFEFPKSFMIDNIFHTEAKQSFAPIAMQLKHRTSPGRKRKGERH